AFHRLPVTESRMIVYGALSPTAPPLSLFYCITTIEYPPTVLWATTFNRHNSAVAVIDRFQSSLTEAPRITSYKSRAIRHRPQVTARQITTHQLPSTTHQALLDPSQKHTRSAVPPAFH